MHHPRFASRQALALLASRRRPASFEPLEPLAQLDPSEPLDRLPLPLAPPAAQLARRLCRRFAAAFAVVALVLALLRGLCPGWLDHAALGPLTWGELGLLLLYPTLCVAIAARELHRRSDTRPHR